MISMRLSNVLFITAAVAVLLAAPAFATGNFTISGTVSDANGAPIQGADVTLADNYEHPVKTIKTDANGNFLFEDANVSTNLCALLVSYYDGNTTIKLPGYYIKRYPASGIQHVDPSESRFDFYTLPGSTPNVTAAPTIIATPTPIPTTEPAASGNDILSSMLIFAGGFIAGAAVVSLAFLILQRLPKP